MLHFLYKTTNLINNKIYYGKHSTKNINDGYLGSGLLLKKAILKYGKENFKREILCFTESKSHNAELEELLIDQTYLAQKHHYNLTRGGAGGDASNFSRRLGAKVNAQKAAKTLKANATQLAERNRKISERQRAFIENNPDKMLEKIALMNATCKGTTKETNEGIQKQIQNRRNNHVEKMNAVMREMTKHDWQKKNPKELIAKLEISGSTFGRMRKKMLNGQFTWE